MASLTLLKYTNAPSIVSEVEVISIIFSSLVGVIIGLIMIKFADKIAEWMGSIVGNSIIRDTNNPFTYKILGGILILYSIVTLFL